MVDLTNQYQHLKEDINKAILSSIEKAIYINGPVVKEFQIALENYLEVNHVITCANGTDALQIALMGLNLERGDEIICPAFTYVATAEVIGLLGLKPVMVEVDSDTFNMDINSIEKVISAKTRAIVPVHLYGQSCDMEPIMNLAKKYNLFVVEDNAQAIGANYRFSDGKILKTGTIGHIGCTSFFPSKNLGCYGDGGALMTNDHELASKIQMIANHGQEKKYYHKLLGCNSRLDTIQAEVLKIKLKHLDAYTTARISAASFYDHNLDGLAEIQIPQRQYNSTHVFHQYTLKVKNGKRDLLKKHLSEAGIPSMIYYPLPLYKQEAFKHYVDESFHLPISEKLCQEVLSLPMHTELDADMLSFICKTVKSFFI